MRNNFMKNITFKHSKIALTVFAALFGTTGAFAQKESAEVKESSKKVSIEVIAVTARKKVESIQNVPMSVNAVTGDFIEDMGINNLEDLGRFVPGLERPTTVQSVRLALRGVSSGDNPSFEQSVGTYVDGVYRGRMNQLHSGMFDMERVEVLKGPQVSLYGNSSIGGAISMMTKRPDVDDDLTGEIKVKYGFEYEEKEIFASVNIPLTDNFAVRIAGKFRVQDEGAAYNNYSQQTEPRSEDDAFRIGAVWQPSDNLNFYLRHEQGDFSSIGNKLDPVLHIDANFDPVEDSPLIGFGMGDDELNIGNDFASDDFHQTETEETMLEVVYDFSDDISLTSITALSSFDYGQITDVDATHMTLIGVENRDVFDQFSQELRLSINISDSLDLIVGGYYQDADYTSDYYRDFNTPLIFAIKQTGDPTNEPLFANFLSQMALHNTLDQNTEQAALFTQVDWAITDKLSATFGARYTEITKTASQSATTASIDHVDGFGDIVDLNPLGVPYIGPEYLFSYGAIAGGANPHGADPALGPFVNPDFGNLSREEDHLMVQASVRYQLDDDFMIYANYANGSKAGGFDILYESPAATLSTDDVEYENEEVDAFEIGFKKDWDDVRLNVGVFYGTYDNLQVSIFNGSVGFNVGNAASSIQQGVDVELSWVATDNLMITANAEYLDFTYDEYDVATCSFSENPLGTNNPDNPTNTCDWSGREMPWVPKIKAVLAAEHIWEISDDYEMTNMLSVSYKSKHTISSSNDTLYMQEGFALFDYRATLTPLDNNWSVSLAVNNLLDEDYEVFFAPIPLNAGAFMHALHEGREFTLEFGYEF